MFHLGHKCPLDTSYCLENVHLCTFSHIMLVNIHYVPKPYTFNVRYQKSTRKSQINVRKHVLKCTIPAHISTDAHACPEKSYYNVRLCHTVFNVHKPRNIRGAPMPEKTPVQHVRRCPYGALECPGQCSLNGHTIRRTPFHVLHLVYTKLSNVLITYLYVPKFA